MVSEDNLQLSLNFDSSEWDRIGKKRSLDELFLSAKKYSRSKEYIGLLNFIVKFKRYSPYNAMLAHVQKPGATYILRACDWLEKYKRTLKPDAQPLLLLQPMGPVMFVFDVSDTEGEKLPKEIESPFETVSGDVGKSLEKMTKNCARDGIRITQTKHGSQRAGSIQSVSKTGVGIKFRNEKVPVKYDVLLNSNHSNEAQFSTLVHELGHLYCGHLGTPNPKWWPDRSNLQKEEKEFEAESVSYLVCKRIGIGSTAAEYLNGYLKQGEIPHISVDTVLTVSGLLERMVAKLLYKRK